MPDIHAQAIFWDQASSEASPAQDEVRRLIQALLTPTQLVQRVILDAGCGNGDYSAGFHQLGAGRVTGIDVSPGSLTTAIRHTPLIPFYQASLTDLPFPESTFDVVWSWGVLHYVPDPVRAIQEVSRVLRPGGVAVIHTLGANQWSAIELGIQQILSRAPRPIQAMMMESGVRVLPLITRLRTGKDATEQTSKSIRQKLQERLFAPGRAHTFSVAELAALFGVKAGKFTVTEAHPPVADLLGRGMSLTVLAQKGDGS